MQTHNSTAPRKAEPYYRTIGTYVQIRLVFAAGVIWHVGQVVAVRDGLSVINVNGNSGGTQYLVDTTREPECLRPFVVAA